MAQCCDEPFPHCCPIAFLQGQVALEYLKIYHDWQGTPSFLHNVKEPSALHLILHGMHGGNRGPERGRIIPMSPSWLAGTEAPFQTLISVFSPHHDELMVGMVGKMRAQLRNTFLGRNIYQNKPPTELSVTGLEVRGLDSGLLSTTTLGKSTNLSGPQC